MLTTAPLRISGTVSAGIGGQSATAGSGADVKRGVVYIHFVVRDGRRIGTLNRESAIAIDGIYLVERSTRTDIDLGAWPITAGPPPIWSSCR